MSPFFRTRFAIRHPVDDLAVHRSAQHKLERLAGRRHVVPFERGPRAGIGDHLLGGDFQVHGAGPFHRHVPSTSAGSAKPAVRCAASFPAQRRSFERSSVSIARQIVLKHNSRAARCWHPPQSSAARRLRRKSSTGRVCCSYASSRSRITSSRSSSRITSCSPSRSHRLSSRGGWETMLYRVPQRGHCRRPVKRAIITL